MKEDDIGAQFEAGDTVYLYTSSRTGTVQQVVAPQGQKAQGWYVSGYTGLVVTTTDGSRVKVAAKPQNINLVEKAPSTDRGIEEAPSPFPI